ncbi:MAG: hypothetical protein IPL33_08960 [Sphingobacteriales bacterium]|nr:hypothetical protein [Sphingobacteriales bacterium]
MRPIRKPESRVLDGLGKVQSLDNTVVNGYNTFATIAVDVGGQGSSAACLHSFQQRR